MREWIAAEKNLIVEVYKNGDQYRAKIIWFSDYPSLPMAEWRDSNNPDPALRDRKVLGMDVLRDLKYDEDSKSWEDGTIYDAKHGREWNASVHIGDDGLLKVKRLLASENFGTDDDIQKDLETKKAHQP